MNYLYFVINLNTKITVADMNTTKSTVILP